MTHSYSHFDESQTLDIRTIEGLRTLISDDLEFSELVSIYISSAKTLMESIQIAFADRDAHQFSLASHSLKSISASIGAIKLSDMCSYLEKMSKTEKIKISWDFLGLLSNEYNQVIADIRVFTSTFVSE